MTGLPLHISATRQILSSILGKRLNEIGYYIRNGVYTGDIQLKFDGGIVIKAHVDPPEKKEDGDLEAGIKGLPVVMLSEMPETPRDEWAAKVIEDLLVFYQLYKENMPAIGNALEFIAETGQKNPYHPITGELARYMREKGLIE